MMGGGSHALPKGSPLLTWCTRTGSAWTLEVLLVERPCLEGGRCSTRTGLPRPALAPACEPTAVRLGGGAAVKWYGRRASR